MVTKNGPKSGSARIMRKPYNFTKNIIESQPVPAHRTTCSSYLIYLYLYLYVKNEKDKIKTNLPFKQTENIFLSWSNTWPEHRSPYSLLDKKWSQLTRWKHAATRYSVGYVFYADLPAGPAV